mgnify:FL=1
MAFELILQCHGATRMMREGGFAADAEPLDAGGIAKIGAFGPPATGLCCVVSPALAARQTAQLWDIAAEVDPVLRDINHGAWRGRTLAEIDAADPDGLLAWMTDPVAGAPHGESMNAVRARMAAWLAPRVAQNESLWAITHPMVMRAAIAAAIGMPLEASLRIDIAPLGIVRLGWNRIWRLQAIERSPHGGR